MDKRPVVFLDVDGVVNHLDTWGAGGRYYWYDTASGYKIRVPHYMADLLQHIYDRADIYWLTTWRDRANSEIAPIVGLPTNLPVIDDGTKDRHVGWKPAAAAPVAEQLRSEGRKIYWIEDFYGNIPWHLDGIEFIDTGFDGGLFPAHLPTELLDGFTTTVKRPRWRNLLTNLLGSYKM